MHSLFNVYFKNVFWQWGTNLILCDNPTKIRTNSNSPNHNESYLFYIMLFLRYYILINRRKNLAFSISDILSFIKHVTLSVIFPVLKCIFRRYKYTWRKIYKTVKPEELIVEKFWIISLHLANDIKTPKSYIQLKKNWLPRIHDDKTWRLN